MPIGVDGRTRRRLEHDVLDADSVIRFRLRDARATSGGHMIGSPGVAAWIAQAGFWILLVLGWAFGELRLVGTVLFLCLWLGGLAGFPHVPYGAALFPPFVALLDIALVFLVFRGDLKIS
jgi:hypothetical protein